MRRAGQLLLALVALVAAAAPWLAPNPPDRGFAGFLYAPPTPVRVFQPSQGFGEASLRAPFIYPQRLVNRLERRFEEDTLHPVRLQWFTEGRLSRSRRARGAYWARRVRCFCLARTGSAATPSPVSSTAPARRWHWPPWPRVFVMLGGIFALLGWPIVARGVRAIVASERERDYAVAGLALGAGPWRLLSRHLLPAAWGYLTVQATLLLPAFILAEATLSYVGLGFPDTVPTWGTMLQDGSNVALLADAPWMLAPAAAIFIVVLAVNLAVQGTGRAPVQLEP